MKIVVVEILTKKALQILRDLKSVDLIKILQPKRKTNLVAGIHSMISEKRTRNLHKQLKSLRQWR